MFRPPVDGRLAGQFAADGTVPIFSAYRKQGTLLVDRCILTSHISPRPFEKYVSGQIVTVISDQQMQTADFEALTQLPRVHHDKVKEQLQVWLDCLDWQEQLTFQRQIALRYEKYLPADDGLAHFIVRDQKALQRLRRKRDLFMMAASLSDSQSRDLWQPQAGQRTFPKHVGQLTNTEFIDPDTFPCDIENRPDLKGQKLAIITFRTEDGIAVQNIPEEGFLLGSVGGDLKPINSARFAIQRFLKGNGHNWFLAYWLFDIQNAAAPTIIKEVYQDAKTFLLLNEDQKTAVEKALNAPDLCLLQGPPGTGKTECISEMCRRACRKGQRVLIASQSNTAVDNVMMLMKLDPSVRPIRYGNRDRLEEDAQCFLKEEVLGMWFSAIKNACLRRIQQNTKSDRKLKEASQALPLLETIESQSSTLTPQIEDLRTRQEQIERQRAGLSEKINTLRQQADYVNRTKKALGELIGWLASNTCNYPSVELVSDGSIDQELDRLISEIRNVLAVQSTIQLPFFDALAQNRWTVLQQLKTAVSCAGAIEELTKQAIAVAQSTDGDQKTLKGQWSKLCRLLQLALINAFGTASLSDLDNLIASLSPSVKWAGLLTELKTLCQTLAGPVGHILTAGSYRIKDRIILLQNETEQKKGDYQQQIEQSLSEKDRLDTEESQINEQLVSLERQYLDIQRRWQQLWPAACTDMETAEPSPSISKETIDNRKAQFQQWLNKVSAHNQRRQLWDTIRKHWIKLLDRPAAAKNIEILNLYVTNANVVGVTCLEAGQRSFYDSEYFKPFDLVIIDEVSKATPAELLMPMMCGHKAVLVGDHRQLPPMQKEKESSYTEALEEGVIKQEDFQRFEKLITASYFERLFTEAPDSIKQWLKIQYRFGEQIMDIVNIFYNGQLSCPDNIEDFRRKKQHNLTIYDRFGGKFLEPDCHSLWIDSSKTPSGDYFYEKQIGSSKVNLLEIELIIASLKLLNQSVKQRGFQPPFKHKVSPNEHGLQLKEWLRKEQEALCLKDFDEIIKDGKFQINGHPAGPDTFVKDGDLICADMRMPIGIITFYGAQLGQIRRRIKELQIQHADQLDCLNIRTNTVDKFQGLEMPIVLVSMVRAPRHGHLGQFVREYRRINVAFSRAQKLLIIIGSAQRFRETIIDLPDIRTGEIKKTTVYEKIYQLVTKNGGRRYARSLINKI
ncbi:MAG: AAA domain-containing protein, partial [Phycisphaerae bacterium]|nr:AAA domain-containing protein [Phycisphaerae bacterium]